MNQQKAREILGDWIHSDGSLHGAGIYWSPRNPQQAEIDIRLTAEQMEAIAWWMQNTPTNL